MKTLFLIASLLFISACGAPPPGHTGLWLRNTGNPGTATIYDWATLPPGYQTQFVHSIAISAQQNGVRCKPNSNVTVGAISAELHTRMNAGKYTGTENLVREQFNVMNDLGCD